jgi:hypothetical protein
VTRTAKIVAFSTLSAFALALRLGLALVRPNVFFPDEIFQTLEPAHRLLFGYGVIPWEWRLGIRSWVLPAFLAGIMRLSAWMGPGSSGYLFGITFVLCLLSLIPVWFGYAWAKRVAGTQAAILAAMACSFHFGLVYFAPKALTEVVAAHVLLPGLYIGVYGDRLGERKRLFLAGLFCGLAACLRMQLLPALLFASLYFCYPRWRRRLPFAAAGWLVPVLVFGAADWITWSYPYQSFIGNFTANLLHGVGKDFAQPQPWYWYALALLVLVGPAVIFLLHGARRSPFLAIFCAVVVVSHTFIFHKEIRFLYPILAPTITLAAIGAPDLFAELKSGLPFLSSPRRLAVVSLVFLAASSALLALLCADWYRIRWGTAAFDRLSREPALCGVGIYHLDPLASGGYTHLHRPVPILPLDTPAQLAADATNVDAIVAPGGQSNLPAGFASSGCWTGVCLYQRPGPCTLPPPDMEINAYLRANGR